MPLPQARSGIDGEAVDPVHRPEEIVPRVGRQDLAQLVRAFRNPVDLEPELDREPLPLGPADQVAVLVEVEAAPLQLLGHVPDRLGLAEVVNVLREPELVDAALRGLLQVALDRLQRVFGLVRLVPGSAEVEVVVDPHRAILPLERGMPRTGPLPRMRRSCAGSATPLHSARSESGASSYSSRAARSRCSAARSRRSRSRSPSST